MSNNAAQFVKFLEGPYLYLNKREGCMFPTFETCYNKNFAYPYLYAKTFFDQGLKATDEVKGKSMLFRLIRVFEQCRDILDDVREIDAMLSICMDRKEFETILATFVTDIPKEEDDLDAEDWEDYFDLFPVRGYLVWYAKKHGYDTSVIDKALEGYQPISRDEMDYSDFCDSALSLLAFHIECAQELYDSAQTLEEYNNGWFQERDIFDEDDEEEEGEYEEDNDEDEEDEEEDNE
jgi:hypothetical protein